MKVFSTIRRKMLASGKIRNYLIYALGEILLIVVGILIAWKINDLNEIRKNKIVQVKIYESLYEELHTNLSVLDSAIVRYTNNTLYLQSSLKYVGLPPNKLTKDTKDLIVQVKFKNSNLRNEALNSINNSNKFQFLESDALTELIAQYPTEINKYKAQELKIGNSIENRLKPVIEKHISLIDLLPERNKQYNHIRTFGQESNYLDLLNSRDYQNSVIDQLLQTQIQLTLGKNLRKKTQILAIKLKQELKG
ncbi:MAG: hypothetical protein ACKVJF_02040 [Flavobacteriales bacterium]